MARVKKQWTIRRHKEDYKAIGQTLGVDPILVWMMRNRGISKEEMESYLHPQKSDIMDPHSLKDGGKAADLLLGAIRDQKKIRIMGDYDIVLFSF